MKADSEKKPEQPVRAEEPKRPYEPPKVESVRLSRDAAESLT
jgi:hypothetical protein